MTRAWPAKEGHMGAFGMAASRSAGVRQSVAAARACQRYRAAPCSAGRVCPSRMPSPATTVRAVQNRRAQPCRSLLCKQGLPGDSLLCPYQLEIVRPARHSRRSVSFGGTKYCVDSFGANLANLPSSRLDARVSRAQAKHGYEHVLGEALGTHEFVHRNLFCSRLRDRQEVQVSRG